MTTHHRQTPYQFFFTHAGYCYDPKTQTPLQGRRQCAKSLAYAELRGRDAGLSFEWSIDQDIDSSEWSDETPAWSTWSCVARTADGKVLASLGGIDFGRDGEPWGSPYRRVVEAELASELPIGDE